MKAGQAPQRYTVDPKEVIGLYHRCVRCLCLRVRENDARRARSETGKFYASATQAMENLQAAHAWQYVGDKQFRVISQGERIVSAPMEFDDLNVHISFTAKSDALLELRDGSQVIAGYHKAVPVDRRERERDLELEADAFALENPLDKNAARGVDKLGIVEFLLAGPQEGAGVIGPSRLTLLDRHPKRLADFMHVVARILTARLAPPPHAHCPLCKRSAVSP
jgi:hypothetical protein